MASPTIWRAFGKLPIAALLLWLPAPVSATWYEARSRHFIVYSEGSPASVRKFASYLERFDQALRKLLNYPGGEQEDHNPMTVYTLDSVSAINSLCQGGRDDPKNCKYIAGWYDARVSGSVAFVPRKIAGGAMGDQATTILFHEYAHHLMLANSSGAYPAWYVEGFAEFVSNAKLDREGEVGIGLPANGRAYSLQNESGLPMSELVTSSLAKLAGSDRGLFYARSWLLTHYLTFSASRNEQLTKYLLAINQGVGLREAAESAFGDLDKLDDEIDAYRDRNRFAYLPIRVPPIAENAIQIRELSAGEAAIMPVRIKSARSVSNETAGGVAEQARHIAAAFPDDPSVQDILAEAEFDADRLDAAEAAVDKALAKAPDNVHALIYKAQILARRADEAGRYDEATWKEVRKRLLMANRIQPDAAWPLYLFYQTFRQQGIKPTVNASDALVRSFVLVPQDNSVRFTLASQLVAEDRLKEARIVLAPMAYSPHLPIDNPAAQWLARIDARLKQVEDGSKRSAARSTDK